MEQEKSIFDIYEIDESDDRCVVYCQDCVELYTSNMFLVKNDSKKENSKNFNKNLKKLPKMTETHRKLNELKEQLQKIGTTNEQFPCTNQKGDISPIKLTKEISRTDMKPMKDKEQFKYWTGEKNYRRPFLCNETKFDTPEKASEFCKFIERETKKMTNENDEDQALKYKPQNLYEKEKQENLKYNFKELGLKDSADFSLKNAEDFNLKKSGGFPAKDKDFDDALTSDSSLVSVSERVANYKTKIIENRDSSPICGSANSSISLEPSIGLKQELSNLFQKSLPEEYKDESEIDFIADEKSLFPVWSREKTSESEVSGIGSLKDKKNFIQKNTEKAVHIDHSDKNKNTEISDKTRKIFNYSESEMKSNQNENFKSLEIKRDELARAKEVKTKEIVEKSSNNKANGQKTTVEDDKRKVQDENVAETKNLENIDLKHTGDGQFHDKNTEKDFNRTDFETSVLLEERKPSIVKSMRQNFSQSPYQDPLVLLKKKRKQSAQRANRPQKKKFSLSNMMTSFLNDIKNGLTFKSAPKKRARRPTRPSIAPKEQKTVKRVSHDSPSYDPEKVQQSLRYSQYQAGYALFEKISGNEIDSSEREKLLEQNKIHFEDCKHVDKMKMIFEKSEDNQEQDQSTELIQKKNVNQMRKFFETEKQPKNINLNTFDGKRMNFENIIQKSNEENEKSTKEKHSQKANYEEDPSKNNGKSGRKSSKKDSAQNGKNVQPKAQLIEKIEGKRTETKNIEEKELPPTLEEKSQKNSKQKSPKASSPHLKLISQSKNETLLSIPPELHCPSPIQSIDLLRTFHGHVRKLIEYFESIISFYRR